MCLQEVWEEEDESQADKIANLLGYEFVYGKSFDFDGVAFGNAIVSKYPIKDYSVNYMAAEPAKHKKVLKAVKGQWGRRKNTIRVAKQAMEKSMQYAYRDRRNKKRDFKSLWIQRINAGVRAEGMTYSKFINGLSKCGVAIDRKILAEIAYDSPEAFKTIVQKAQSALN